MQPLAIDLYSGLGGWAEGFLAEGYRVRGYDIVKHDYGTGTYPGELILRDVRSIHGSECADARVIVASPPCQEPSYRSMPWKRAKALNEAGPPANFIELFNACFRIQREASEVAGRYIPLIVENVRGAQRWVGRARWHFGSYYLWGDVPALMPPCLSPKIAGQNWSNYRKNGTVSDHWRMEGTKLVQYANIRDGYSHTRHLTNAAEHIRIEESGVKLQSPGHYRKVGSGSDWFDGGSAAHGSKSKKRAAAAAAIAKIPFPLAQWIASCFK